MLNRGLRGVPTLVTNVSTVCRDRGLIFRGHEIGSLVDSSVLDLFWMGVTGRRAEPDELADLGRELDRHARPDPELLQLIDALGPGVEPILVFSHCFSFLAARMEHEDTFRAGHGERADAAVQALEHVKRIVALSLPLIGAIHARRTGRPQDSAIDWSRSWGANLCRALGVDEAHASILEIHGIVHIDQGKGNPSSHVSHLVATTGADPYRCIAASLIALSCPSHAFAGIGVLEMIEDLQRRWGSPTREQVREYLTARLRQGERIYGVGQAVMKNVDSRFTCLQQAAAPLLRDDPYLRIMETILDVVGDVFQAVGNTKIVPQPNVNMISSIILCRSMGVDRAMLPLLFAASRIIGNLCQYIENLIMPSRLYRPQSHTTEELGMSQPRPAWGGTRRIGWPNRPVRVLAG